MTKQVHVLHFGPDAPHGVTVGRFSRDASRYDLKGELKEAGDALAYIEEWCYTAPDAPDPVIEACRKVAREALERIEHILGVRCHP